MSRFIAWFRRALAKTWRPLLVLAALVPLGWKIYQQWPDIQASLAGVDRAALGGAFLLLLPILPFIATTSWVVLRSLHIRLPLVQVYGIYFISQAPKYLPGGFWAFPGRVIAYQAVGVPGAPAALSVVREVIALFLGAVAVGSLVAFQNLPIPDWARLTILAAVLACLLGVLLTQARWFWAIFQRLPLLKNSSYARMLTPGEGSAFQNLLWLPGGFSVSALFWLAMGLPMRAIAIAVNPAAAALNLLETAAIFALAWAIGFAIVFLPAGLGAREAALTLLLSTTLPPGDAISIALLSRLAWMLVEAVWILISLWAIRRPKPTL